jgi:uncharacterized RDD family membrane protein YckC
MMLTFRDESIGRSRNMLAGLRIAAFTTMQCPNCQSQLSPYAGQCDRCGEDIPAGQHLLEESGIVQSAPAPEPKSAVPTRSRNSGDYRFATLGDRFIAFVLDSAMLFGLFAIVDAWAFMRWGAVEGAELQLTTAAVLVAVVLNSTILFLYGWLLEGACGATLGKALVGIRVVGSDGRGIFSSCAVRNALRVVDGIGFYILGALVAGCSSIRQRIGDLFAQTAVVEESYGIGIRLGALIVLAGTLAGAGYVVPRICAVDRSVHSQHLNQVVVRVGRNGNSAYFRVAKYSVDVSAPSLQ